MPDSGGDPLLAALHLRGPRLRLLHPRRRLRRQAVVLNQVVRTHVVQIHHGAITYSENLDTESLFSRMSLSTNIGNTDALVCSQGCHPKQEILHHDSNYQLITY